MRLRITCDANAESGIGAVIDEISGPTEDHFATEDYGVGLVRIGIIFMCRNPDLKFKQRIRFSKKDKKLYMDIMLDLSEMVTISHQARKRIVYSHLVAEMPAILDKYSISDFDHSRFMQDFKNWFEHIKNLEASAL